MRIFIKAKKAEPPDSTIPVTAIDLSKRYDLYCSSLSEEVLYEDVKIIGIRTLERMQQFSTALIGGYIEIEASDGTRMMIKHHDVHLICENGFQPKYKVLRTRKLDKGE